MVASDRLSAFDVVMAEPIPDKGRVLTAMTAFWDERARTRWPAALVELRSRGDRRARSRASSTLRRPTAHDAGRGAPRCCPSSASSRARLAGQAYEEYVGQGHGPQHGAPGGAAADRRAARADVHPLDQGRGGPRPQHLARRGRAHRRRRPARRQAMALCLGVFAVAAARWPRPGSCSPTPSSSWASIDGELVLCDEVVTPDSSRIWPADRGRHRRDAAVVRQAALPRLARRAALGPHAAAAGACPPRSSRVTAERYVDGLRAGDRALPRRLVRSLVVRYHARVEVTLAPRDRRSRGRDHRAGAARARLRRRRRRAGRTLLQRRARRPGRRRRSSHAAALADRLLANPVIEESLIEVTEL